jgi:DNA-binding HxlR family transcriptional regulator
MLRTKKQTKAICSDCPLAKTANILGDTFNLLIIRDLLIDPKRFSQLETSLHGVSTRTITNKLSFLETEGLIERRTSKDKPPHIEYSLTKKGRALHKIMDTMKIYGERYL